MYSKQHPPALHVYLNADHPAAAARSRRYVPLQLEYYAKLFESESIKQFMQNAVVAWEYASQHVQHWRAMGGRLVTTRYVRTTAHARDSDKQHDCTPSIELKCQPVDAGLRRTEALCPC